MEARPHESNAGAADGISWGAGGAAACAAVGGRSVVAAAADGDADALAEGGHDRESDGEPGGADDSEHVPFESDAVAAVLSDPMNHFASILVWYSRGHSPPQSRFPDRRFAGFPRVCAPCVLSRLAVLRLWGA